MKKIIKFVLQNINKLFYPNFLCPDELIVTVFKNGIFQKIWGYNRNVAWPVHWTSKILCPKNINPGSRAPGLSISCYIDGRGGLDIGTNVWIGPRVSIISKNHDLNNYKKYVSTQKVSIGSNCWLGANCVILPGVSLGDHTVVAAGSVVSKSFTEGNLLIGGVPAKILKKLNNYNS